MRKQKNYDNIIKKKEKLFLFWTDDTGKTTFGTSIHNTFRLLQLRQGWMESMAYLLTKLLPPPSGLAD